MNTMPCLLWLALCLIPSDAPTELISAFQALPPGASAKKIELLDRLHALKSEEGERFIANVMDTSRNERVKSHAFLLWAQGKAPETVVEYLDTKKNVSGFEAFIPVLPKLSEVDVLAYLMTIYDDDLLTRYWKPVSVAIASLDNQEAFDYLEEKWEACTNFRKAFDLLPSILSMASSRNAVFLENLMNSRFAFARADGAKRLLRLEGEFNLDKVGDFLEREMHPRVRSEVLRAIAGLRDPQAVKMILQAAASHAEGDRFELVDLLAGMPPDLVEEAIPAHWYHEHSPLRFQVIALAYASSPELSRKVIDGQLDLLKKQTRSRFPQVRIAAAVALDRLMGSDHKIKSVMVAKSVDDQWEILDTVQNFRLDDATVQKKMLSLLGSQNLEIRIKSAEVLSALGVREAIPQLKKYLGSKKLFLRIAAIKALGSLGGKEVVPELIERLRREKGRAAWEIARSLRKATGRDFAVNQKQWEEWWEKNAEVFTPPSVWEGLWLSEGEGESRYGFYGLSIDSHNIMYVLDVSGSMNDGFRIKALREELTRALKGLTGTHFINMIFFSSTVTKWKDELVPLEGGRQDNKTSALLRARYLYAEGGTNLYGALDAALDDPEVDSVVLLSDGDPTVGKIIDKRAILAAVLKKNRITQATIHVVAIGSADRTFLRKLAESTGGTFVSR